MTPTAPLPRLVVAGLSGDSGKTLVSLALLLEAAERGLPARAFKKGPDYIDAAWLGWACGAPARNLDTYLMGFSGAAASFRRHAEPAALNLVEGNRGLFDGIDARGTHSTAELAKTLAAPVVLVLNATKITRTAAALVLGCRKLDPELAIAGVIVNYVASPRHERVLRESIQAACGVPVLGALPKLSRTDLLPQRHLGLVTPEEHPRIGELRRSLLELTRGRIDFEKLLEIVRAAPPVGQALSPVQQPPDGAGLKIGYLKDSAFTFYYPENLEAIACAGAGLVPVSPLCDTALPLGLHALYIGGGFPETHAAALAANDGFLASLRERAAEGLPVYAECGGMMLLCRAIHWQGRRYPMAGVLPLEIEVCSIPQGHGYSELTVDRHNPFFPLGQKLKGHEFHYSRVLPEADLPPTACQVTRGAGCYPSRDGITVGNIWASYTHLHALGAPEWASGLIQAARRFARTYQEVIA